MQPHTLPMDLHQDCLNKLNRALALVLQTAEKASTENNHKVVIQAAREVTRIATLITKMSAPGTKSKPHQTPGSPLGKNDAPAALPNKKISQRALAHILPDFNPLFPPQDGANPYGVSQGLLKNISKNYQELQAIGAEMAGSLDKPAKGRGSKA